MTTLQKTSHFWRNPWRILLWGTVSTLLLLPLISMQFTTEVNWTGFDFVVAGILLGGTAVLIELGCRLSANLSGRAGWALLVLTCLLLIWINLAVGIIGSEDNPANLLYLIVLASIVLGAVWVRFQAHTMSRVLYLTVALQLGIEVVIQLAGLGAAPVINVAFMLLWLLAAALLRNSGASSTATEA
jgi:hypothetical protein